MERFCFSGRLHGLAFPGTCSASLCFRLIQERQGLHCSSVPGWHHPHSSVALYRQVFGSSRQLLGTKATHSFPIFKTRVLSPVERAAGLAAVEVSINAPPVDEPPPLASEGQQALPPSRGTGVFQTLPQVSPSYEIIGSAVRRAERVPVNKKIKNETQKLKNRVARQLDTLTKEVAVPLGRYMTGFPTPSKMHPFEEALMELTVGGEVYVRALQRVDVLRKAVLEVGKSHAARANKCHVKREVQLVQEEGYEALQRLYGKGAHAVDDLKEVAKKLRRLPVVDVKVPTVVLVGAPNVGKSSLVQLLSSGTPEVCNYPFTTRSIKMGHFFVDGRRHQVTDTPGLLHRPLSERNKMERLTLACLQHLPTTAIFVMDITGDCGTSPQDQWRIREELRESYPSKPWIDVFSKADLLQQEFAEADDRLQRGEAPAQQPSSAVEVAAALPYALRVSSVTQVGLDHMKAAIMQLLGFPSNT